MVMLSFEWDLAQYDAHLSCVSSQISRRGIMLICLLFGRRLPTRMFTGLVVPGIVGWHLKAFAPIKDV